jgi:hypothetical protein
MPPIQALPSRPPGIKAPPLLLCRAHRRIAVRVRHSGFTRTGALADSFEGAVGFVVANIKRGLDEAVGRLSRLVKVNVC